MGQEKFSDLLIQLMNDSRKIGNSSDAPFTAERFFVSIINRIVGEEISPNEKELFAVNSVIKKMIPDIKQAREALLEYINRDSGATYLDSLYMMKKLQEADTLAQKTGREEIDTTALVMCIVVSPSKAIKAVMADTSEVETLGADTTASDISTDSKKMSNDKEMSVERENAIDTNSSSSDFISTKAAMTDLINESKRIRNELRKTIYGQDNAINLFISGYFQANMLSMTDDSRKRPRATFLFAGPPGVGKTFLAEKAAELLKLPFARYDMSEYSDAEACVEFCGSDEIYKNAKKGNVTSFVDENPKCVLLFDEIEKAHISVIHLFLQMLDAGRLRDNHSDKEVSFTDAIIIFTTNAGKQLYENSESGNFSSVPRRVILKALQKDVNPHTQTPYFPPAICSRFASGNIVMFNHMGAHNLIAIAKKEILRHINNIESKTGIKIQVDERVYTSLLFAEGSSADARTIRGRAEAFINDELYELFRILSSEKVNAKIEDLEKITIGVDLTNANAVVSTLYEPAEKTRVLVFANQDTVTQCKGRATNFEIYGVCNYLEAVEMLKNMSVDLVLIDMKCDVADESINNLNIEDVESSARDFLRFIKESGKSIPVYVLEKSENSFGEEEKLSLVQQGVRDILNLSETNDKFAEQLDLIASVLYRQSSLIRLSSENKVISFETSQGISKDGKEANIKLFDFKMTVAVESEDAQSLVNSLSRPNVRFDEVLGAADAKKELEFFVNYLHNPKKYMGTGLKAPKGVLLYGPPGTGKTMLAKAMACEAGVTFIAAEGNQFLKKYVGEGSEKVHQLFKTARKYSPSILFIDEIDAIAKERSGESGASVAAADTLTAFLTEMDGFVNDPSRPVFVLAATNYDVTPGGAKSLDPALLRRFDRLIYVDLPGKGDRIKFLKMKSANNKALNISDELIDNIAMRSTGMSLAQLDSVVELALRSAIRAESVEVTDNIFEEAFETFNSGEVKKWDASQLERVARHEAGHALISWLSGDTPEYITIVARGSHGGYMQASKKEGKAIYTKDELLSSIRTSLAGRAAEVVYYGERDGVSTGASGDLAHATYIAEQMVCVYGMDDEVGLGVVNGAISDKVKDAVDTILKDQMSEAISLISKNKSQIDALVTELIKKDHLSGSEIKKILC